LHGLANVFIEKDSTAFMADSIPIIFTLSIDETLN